jgi:pilus assembly protein Flp/PilA
MLTYISVLSSYLKTLVRDEEGASAVEYGLILALVAIAIVVTLGLMGTTLDGLFVDVNTELGAAP